MTRVNVVHKRLVHVVSERSLREYYFEEKHRMSGPICVTHFESIICVRRFNAAKQNMIRAKQNKKQIHNHPIRCHQLRLNEGRTHHFLSNLTHQSILDAVNIFFPLKFEKKTPSASATSANRSSLHFQPTSQKSANMAAKHHVSAFCDRNTV